MILSTGLVSLNVHEALTFDGTEIVLHPDLFGANAADGVLSTVNSIAGNSTARQSSSIRASPSAAGSTGSSSTVVAAGATVAASVEAGIGKDGPAAASKQQPTSSTAATSSPPSHGPTTAVQPSSSGEKLAWTGGGNSIASSQQNRRLEVGDMIEIRVWDPIPTRERQPSPGGISGVFRKRSTTSVQSASTTGSVSTKDTGNTNNRDPLKASSSHHPSTTAASTKAGPGGSSQQPSSVKQSASAPPAASKDSDAQQATGNFLILSTRQLSGTTQVTANSMQYSEASLAPPDMPQLTSSSNHNKDQQQDAISTGGGSVGDQSSKKSAESSNKSQSTTATHNKQPQPPQQQQQPPPQQQTTTTTTPAVSLPSSPFGTKNIFTKPRASLAAAITNVSNTTIGDSATTATPLPKPPLQPRQSSHGETFAAYEARKRKPGHSREISDMTVDSVTYGSNTATTTTSTVATSATSKNLALPSDLSVPIGLGLLDDDSHDDDDDNDDNDVVVVEVDRTTDAQRGVAGGLPSIDQEEDTTAADYCDDDTEEDDILSHIGRTHTLRFSVVMLVADKTLTSLKGSARTQVSMLRQVADLYHLSSYDMVSINRIEKEDEKAVLSAMSADFVLVTIKDQFVSRGDMHFFQKSLIGSWVYEGQRLSDVARGIKAHAWLVRHGNRPAKSGIVTEDTMITFRSRSARIFWLVQISAEMWDYASPYERERGDANESLCEIYFDKWISFVYRLFERWKALEVTHSLTVVFFSRTFLSSRQAITINSEGGSLDCKDVYGRPYEDHYKMVIENETRTDWESLVVKIKEEFLKYPVEVAWNLSTGDLGRRPSTASQGNVLEAINITMNLLQHHYLDRDLHRTGNSVVVISSGSGVFEVDKGLASITYQRMMDNGIGSDVLSLGLPPLHIAPFFLYNNEYQSVESRGVDTSETYYELPHWMHLSFVSYDTEADDVVKNDAKFTEPEVVKKNQTDPGPTVAANGFILPPTQIPQPQFGSATTSNSASSFSVNGIAASSPIKRKIPHERALNEGRDFFDILEACRPRNSGAIPSALQALLRMYRKSEKADRPQPESDTDDNDDGEADELKPLREWTSMDLDLDEPFKAARQRSGSFGKQERNMRVSADSDSSALSSPSSSFTGTSLLSSHIGVSYDRHILGRNKNSAAVGGIQLQRSQSLNTNATFDNAGDADTVRSDGSLSTMGPEASDDEMQSREQHDRNKLAEQIRAAIASYDSNYFTESQTAAVALPLDGGLGRSGPALDTSMHSLSPIGGLVIPPQRYQRQNEGSQSGGIGAALSQYSTSNDWKVGNESAPGRPHRVASTSFVPGRSAPLAVSPLFYTSSGLSSGLASGVPYGNDPPDLIRPDDRLIASRLLAVGSGRDFRMLSSGSMDPAAGSRSLHTIPVGQQYRSIASDFFQEPRRTGSEVFRGRKPDKPGQRHRESSSQRAGRKKVFNPFRQEDEDRVLAKRSHNRRRWSHVFPVGEIEFKRHSGPLWKSLSSPAILPLSVDYFPSRQEIDQYFQFNIYNVTLSEFEDTHYATHADLLMEMVRQRLSQDFQVVPLSCVDESIHRRPIIGGHASFVGGGKATSINPNPPLSRSENVPTIKHFLTMGHRLQELTYDPNSDTIEVIRYNAKSAQNDAMNTYNYQYLVQSSLTGKYTKVVQTFKKYANQYNWNKVDRIICGDEDKTLREGMRFRRLMFGLIPMRFSTAAEETDFVAKFKRLIEYLGKLRESNAGELKIEIVQSSEDKTNLSETKTVTGPDSMNRSTVQLKKGKRDSFEWFELAIDPTFSPLKSYRIIYNWLAASSAKIDTQVQILHRRCAQFGLTLYPFPQTSVSRDLLLNPFKVPPTFSIRDAEKAKLLYTKPLELDFINDGVFHTQTKPILQCIENGNEFDFGRRLSIPGRQLVHRSGTLFLRMLRDRRGWVILVVIANSRHIKKEPELAMVAQMAFRSLVQLISSLTSDEDDETEADEQERVEEAKAQMEHNKPE